MRPFEIALVVTCSLGGVRSLWTWSRRRFESTSVADQVLYALYLTGRVGLWFAFAGFFLIYALVDARGRPLLDELARLRWYFMVPIALGALQLVAGLALGRRSSE